MNNFLVQSRKLINTNDLSFRYEVDHALRWLNMLPKRIGGQAFDLDNIEQVYSLAHLEDLIGVDGSSYTLRCLRRLLLETLELCCKVDFEGGRFIPDPLHEKFIRHLNLTDTLISFNYDLLLDYTLELLGIRRDYNLGEYPRRTQERSRFPIIKLLKLHGSVNWWRMPYRGSDITLCQPVPDTPPKEGIIPLRVGVLYAATNKIAEPLMIPPSWNKIIDIPYIRRIWAGASRALRQATHITIIGYSFPAIDQYFGYMLTHSLSQNHGLEEITIINPDTSGGLRKRVHAHMPSGCKRKLNIVGCSYEQYVNSLQRHGNDGSISSRIELPAP